MCTHAHVCLGEGKERDEGNIKMVKERMSKSILATGSGFCSLGWFLIEASPDISLPELFSNPQGLYFTHGL